jgi:hypothetical protein
MALLDTQLDVTPFDRGRQEAAAAAALTAAARGMSTPIGPQNLRCTFS